MRQQSELEIVFDLWKKHAVEDCADNGIGKIRAYKILAEAITRSGPEITDNIQEIIEEIKGE